MGMLTLDLISNSVVPKSEGSVLIIIGAVTLKTTTLVYTFCN